MTEKNKGQVPDTEYPQIHTAAVKPSVIEAALRADAKAYYSTNNALYTKYIADNRQPYFVVSNTWYLLIKEYCGTEVPEFHSILAQGLLPLIAAAKETSDALIQDTQLPVNLFTYVLRPITCDDLEGLRQALQVLRYPKRFSPYVTDALEDQCITDFRNRNNKAKMLNRQEMPRWLAERLRAVVNCVLEDWDYSPVPTYFESVVGLPKGTTAEGCKSIADKVKQIEQTNPLYFYPYNVEPVTESDESENWCNCVTVPKTADKRRVIAEEQCYRQTVMYTFFDRLDQCLESSSGRYGTKGRVTLHDQSRNQHLAQRGSVWNSLATVDLSAASDSVTAGLVRTIFPPRIVREWDKWRSKYVSIRGKKTLLHLYATMGSRLTFGVETICFWALACAATEEAARWLGYPFIVDDISVYGDDIIVPVWAYDTLVSFLEMTGFTVNNDKSFADGPYRESCGREYYAGYEISSQYYPRTQVEIAPNGDLTSTPAPAVAQLIALQHRLFSHRSVNTFLTELILEAVPDMTFSTPGSEYSDLWSDFMPPATTFLKKFAIETSYDEHKCVKRRLVRTGESSDVSREYHYVLQTVYPASRSRTAERWAYMAFLLDGPFYATPLDELLGVSSPRPVESYQSSGTNKLVRKLS